MKKCIASISLVALLLSFSFLFLPKVTVEAAPCFPGNYSVVDYNDNWKCKKTSEAGNGQVPGRDDMGKNQISLDGESDTAPWVNSFVAFLVTLSKLVAYFTEIVAMLIIAYSAYIYTTSEGEPRKLRQAKMYLMYAFIGMFIGAFALVIARMLGGIL